MSELDLMCVYVPNANISAMTQAFGIKNVAIWPNGAYQFMDDKNNQRGTSWYTLLSNFLATASNH